MKDVKIEMDIVEIKEPAFKRIFKEFLEVKSFDLVNEEPNSVLGKRDTIFLELKKIIAPNQQTAYVSKLYDEENNVYVGMPPFKDRRGKLKQRHYRLNITNLKIDVAEMLRIMDERNTDRTFLITIQEWDYQTEQGIATANGYKKLVISKAQLPERLRDCTHLKGWPFIACGILKKGEEDTVRRIIEALF
jgi:hypothetical protein